MHRLNRLICWAHRPEAPALLRFCLKILLHVELPPMKWSVHLPHPYNVVVHPDAGIGKEVTIYHNVTIGRKHSGAKAGVPTISDEVTIFPHAVVLGSIVVGRGATIGAAAVVLDDVPRGATVVGNPARQVGYANKAEQHAGQYPGRRRGRHAS